VGCSARPEAGDPTTTSAAFELHTGPASSSTVAGFWTVTPAHAPSPVDVWRVKLPRDTRLAAAGLASGSARLAAAERAVPVAAERLRRVVESWPAPSYALAAGGPQPRTPEAELVATLTGAATMSYGDRMALGGLKPDLEELLGRLGRQGRVETLVEGLLVARTSFGWTGDLATAWRGDVSGQQASLHGQSVGLALASWQLVIRTVALTVRWALALAVMLTSPVGPLLALRAAWRFVNRVLAEAAGGS
jgi:hypothetical protein